MRILAIRGARLASLEAPFEVDLTVEPLRSAGVFAIVGPTGAGKSSLLDALCLALFDTTPRLDRTPRQRIDDEDEDDLSARDARTLVRRGARDAYAEADFLGVDGVAYRARWSVERGRTGRLRPAQLSLRDIASGRNTSGTKGEVLAAIEGKLGLGLAELRRAVILPQGEVAAFLDAPSDERALLLERLTGAEIFAEVSKVVHGRAADARRARENVEVTLGMLSVLDAADVLRIGDELVTLRIDAARAEERTAALVAHRDRRAGLTKLREEEAAAREALSELEHQRALAELTRDDVRLAERADAVAAELSDERRAGQGVREATARCDSERTGHREAFASLAPLAVSVEQRRLESVQLEERRHVEHVRLQSELEAARAAIVPWSIESSAEIERLRAREKALTQLARTRERLRAAQACESRARKNADEADRLAEASEASAQRLDARALELALDATAQSARLDEAQRGHERLVASRSLEAHRAHLVDGHPCPLCGALDHPHAKEPAGALVTESEARIATIRLALERTRATLARVQVAVKAHKRDATGARARSRAGHEEARAAHDEVGALRREASEGAAGVAVDELDAVIARELALGEARIKELDAEVGRERTATRALSRVELALRTAHEVTTREREVFTTRLDEAIRAHDRADSRARALAESVTRHEAAVVEAHREHDVVRAAADAALQRLGLARADAERVLGPDRDRIRRARAELLRLDHDRASARARLEERESRRVAAEADLARDTVPAGEALDGAISTARAARDDARRREATLEATLTHDRNVRERADELERALDRATKDEARWRGLDALIGAADGKRFRAHAQSITLERLVGFANAELAHLAPRFSLARAPAAGELALSVVDRESGHARRSVQSLSGGESFLVSLALALGLAAMTAAEGGRGALTASSLFLDEGLGALDPSSLEIALGALEALRASGRQIAIVTHVPQVAERFAARVEVVPRGAGRSDVRVLAG